MWLATVEGSKRHGSSRNRRFLGSQISNEAEDCLFGERITSLTEGVPSSRQAPRVRCLRTYTYHERGIDMGLTIGSWQIADPRVQGVNLRSTIGGLELIFDLRVPILAVENAVRRVSVAGCRITVRADSGGPGTLGFARPERPFEINSVRGGTTESHDLYLYLQPGQLAALERRCEELLTSALSSPRMGRDSTSMASNTCSTTGAIAFRAPIGSGNSVPPEPATYCCSKSRFP